MRLRPYSFFFLLSLGLLLIGYFTIQEDSTLSVNLGDTYFVAAYRSFFFIMASLAAYVYLSYWDLWYPSTQEALPYFELYEERMTKLSYVILVFLIGQLMFPLNIFRSVLLRARRGMPEEDFEV